MPCTTDIRSGCGRLTGFNGQRDTQIRSVADQEPDVVEGVEVVGLFRAPYEHHVAGCMKSRLLTQQRENGGQPRPASNE